MAGVRAATQRRLQDLLPGFSAAANPTDLTAASIGREDVFTAVCRAIHDDANVDVIMPVLTFAPAQDILSLAAFAERADKPVAVLWTGKCGDDASVTPESLVAARARRVPRCAAGAQGDRGRDAVRRGAPATGAAPRRGPRDIDPDAARRLLANARGALDEHASKAAARGATACR